MSRTGNGSSSAKRSPRAAKSAPTHEQIALRAYEIYLERGGTSGHELEDWTRAERELLTKKNAKSRRKSDPKPIAA